MSTPASWGIDPIPSFRRTVSVTVVSELPGPDAAGAVAVPLMSEGEPPARLGVSRSALAAAGFTGERGQTLVVPAADGPALVVIGIGDGPTVDAAQVRHLAAGFARAVPHQLRLAVELPTSDMGISPGEFAEAVTEGVLLARWRFYVGQGHESSLLDSLVIVAPEDVTEEVTEGIRRGLLLARASNLGRDLSNCPAATLTAKRMGELAEEIGPDTGLEVTLFDKDQLLEMGCGGILGVNMGSVEPPCLIRLHYRPESPTGRLALIGKGIMYDSGGISLKPSNESHAQMKNDMTGAAAIFAAMLTLRDLGCTSEVIGYLCCTDNMPSGSAMRLGDILTMRNGKTVEVKNTDAEGRLVMADGLALAVEDGVDAIVDIATLTGACLATFGVDLAGVMGNNEELIGQVKTAGEHVDEPVWQLPLHHAYRKQLDSPVADMTNLGGPFAGSITAGLFLEEYVGGLPWAHIDIAGTAQLPAPSGVAERGRHRLRHPPHRRARRLVHTGRRRLNRLEPQGHRRDRWPVRPGRSLHGDPAPSRGNPPQPSRRRPGTAGRRPPSPEWVALVVRWGVGLPRRPLTTSRSPKALTWKATRRCGPPLRTPWLDTTRLVRSLDEQGVHRPTDREGARPQPASGNVAAGACPPTLHPHLLGLALRAAGGHDGSCGGHPADHVHPVLPADRGRAANKRTFSNAVGTIHLFSDRW